MQLDLSYLLLRSATVKQVLKNPSTNGESLSLYQLRCLNCQFSNASSPDWCFEWDRPHPLCKAYVQWDVWDTSTLQGICSIKFLREVLLFSLFWPHFPPVLLLPAPGVSICFKFVHLHEIAYIGRRVACSLPARLRMFHFFFRKERLYQLSLSETTYGAYFPCFGLPHFMQYLIHYISLTLSAVILSGRKQACL